VFPIHGVRDYTCGFRAYRCRLLREAFRRYGDDFVDRRGFECMVDILLKLHRLGATFAEVPLTLRYDRKGGASKMRVARTVADTLRLMLRRRLGR
jgi:dolichol-phosphate mannosyltransferase